MFATPQVTPHRAPIVDNRSVSSVITATGTTESVETPNSLGIIKEASLPHSVEEMSELHNGVRPFGVEFISPNAHMLKDFFTNKLGFELIGYNGPDNHGPEKYDSGDTTARSYALKEGVVTFLLTEALMDRGEPYRYDTGSTGAMKDDPHARLAFQNSHKAGARTVLKAVPAEKNFHELIVKTAENYNASHETPLDIEALIQDEGHYRYATIPSAGGINYTFFQSNQGLSPSLPGYQALSEDFLNVSAEEVLKSQSVTPRDLERTGAFIDHIVTNGPEDTMELITHERAVLFGHKVSQRFSPVDVRTEFTALYSQVSHSGPEGTRTDQNEYTPVNEPVPMREKLETSGGRPVYLGQIEAHVDASGTEIQHIALNYPDVVDKVGSMRDKNFQFLKNVGGEDYYEKADEFGWSLRDYMVREGGFSEARFDRAKALNIMFSIENKEGIRRGESPKALVQIFSRHIFGEMSLFFEFITRHNGAQGFGKENFNGLYRSLEELQKELGLFVRSDPQLIKGHDTGHDAGVLT